MKQEFGRRDRKKAAERAQAAIEHLVMYELIDGQTFQIQGFLDDGRAVLLVEGGAPRGGIWERCAST